MRKSIRRTVFLMAAMTLPLWGWAGGGNTLMEAPGSVEDVSVGTDMQDQKRQDDKKTKRDDRRRNDRQDEKRPDKSSGKKPEIKEVPKSIPKLKPKSVTDRVKIKRPPVKVKPKGLFRVI